ncbi:chagasin family peptidase inhibitor I42 [Streptomyces sp. Amel2xB2]|uniref:protease inhibitor I42 family protein n=1 Tax=Streptomyces sp. Amel2xB2 TaxID=1305829 RepID=UPI000DBFB0AB|nr:protease inhibitor I42 family protein [Streptomyces sp. Amel2xB2]RAJ70065.1 chagasin family peptidase inhibitor I42 [Streptomyces sp. Amel2xB2]
MTTVRNTPIRLACSALLAGALAGCGLTGPDTYELGETNVEVEKGEEFTLSVPVETAQGEWWYLTTPKPDAAVVDRLGKDEEVDGDDDDEVGGSSGTDLFTFKAVGTGTTKIRLIQCPRGACAGGGSKGGPVTPSPVPSGSPTPDADERATVHTYTVTVTQP